MGLPRVVSREVMRGKQGPRGLAALDSAAWQWGADYVEGDIVQADDGSLLYCLTDHTSGADLMDDLAYWTPVETLDGGITEAALQQEYAAKSVQNEIEAGRLNDAVLSGRFGKHYESYGAAEMWTDPASGISRAPIGGYTPVIRLDGNTDEYALVGSKKFHRSWAKANASVTYCNMSASSGTALVRVLISAVADGETTGTETVGNLKAIGVPATQYEQDTTTVVFGFDIEAHKKYSFRILRDADDALDTLGNDFGLLSLDIEPTAYVTFTPELPEEPEVLAGRTFTQVDSDALDIRVWHQWPPPVDDLDDDGYPAHPMTDSTTLQDFTVSTNTTVNKGPFVWANRWNYGQAWNKRPNYVWGPSYRVGDYECRTVFTSLELANAATLQQIKYIAGTDDAAASATAWTAAGGDVTVGEATAKADLATYFTEDFPWAGVTYRVAVDTLILPAGTLPEAHAGTGTGVVLDYEVGDSRTPQETQDFIESVADALHDEGYTLFLYTNPLTNFVQQYHGIDSTNLPALLTAVDYMGVMLTSNLALEGSVPSAWSAAISRLGGPLTTEEWEKVVIVFELGVNPGTTLADAEWVYDKLHEVGDDHPTKLMFWRYWAVLGGDHLRLTNQKICMACFGTLTPPSMEA